MSRVGRAVDQLILISRAASRTPPASWTKNGCVSVDTAGVALYFGSCQVLSDLPPRIAFEMNV
jgi:hypothetical protein